MPNWKKVIVSGSDANLNEVTASSGIQVGDNILPNSDNTLSLGSNSLRFQLNGGTPVTVTGSGTNNTVTRFNGATEVENSTITNTDNLTTITHNNDGNAIFIVSGSNGELIKVTDNITGTLFQVNDGSGISQFDVSSTGLSTTSDVSIDDWGSVSASLAALDVSASSADQNLQEVTDNGSTTTNSITVDTNVHVGRGGGSINTNTAVGNNSLGSNSTGTNNAAFGKDTLSSITDAHQNVAFGDGALRDLTTTGAVGNTAIGYQSLRDSTGTSGAVAIGAQSAAGASGNTFTAVGYQSLLSATGDSNTALGYRALYLATSADENTAVGTRALQELTTGDNNTAIGKDSGLLKGNGGVNTTSANGVFLGYNTKPATQTSSNEIVIGYNAVGNGSNTVTIGNSSITNNYFSGNIDADDITIDDWGSVSASLASIDSNVTLQEATDNGNTTTNSIIINNVELDSGKITIADGATGIFGTFSASTYAGATVDYVVYNSGRTNQRTGMVTVTSNTTEVIHSELVTTDIGSTDGMIITTTIGSGNFKVNLDNNSGASVDVIYNIRLLKI